MRFFELQNKAKNYPLFKLEDIFKWFPQESRQNVLNQVKNWGKKGLIQKIKRGIYKLTEYEPKDSFILANFLYSPSYISLESALNYYSIIPDVPFSVTSVTIKKTVSFKTGSFGSFIYRRVKPELFFGFQFVAAENYNYSIAEPEKALLDFIYLYSRDLNKESFPQEQRFYFEKDFDWQKFQKYSRVFSSKNKHFHCLVDILLKNYAK